MWTDDVVLVRKGSFKGSKQSRELAEQLLLDSTMVQQPYLRVSVLILGCVHLAFDHSEFFVAATFSSLLLATSTSPLHPSVTSVQAIGAIPIPTSFPLDLKRRHLSTCTETKTQKW